MKYKLTKRVALVLVGCVACVLALGVTLAQADVNSGLGGNNELTLRVADDKSEVKDVSAQVNLYRIATGSKDATYDTYNFAFDVAAFAKLGEGYDPQTMSNESWQRMADAAKKIVEENKIKPDATAPVGEKITGLADGIYLALIPNTTSDTYEFTFVPSLVAVPGKVGEDGAPVYNTASGSWTNEVTAVVKWSMAPLYGKLLINKTVKDFSGEPATFVYHIVDAETGGEKYENYAAVQYTAKGVQSTTVGKIPAGMTVNVTEVNTGARYQVVGAAEQTAVISADQDAAVDFVNEPDDSGKKGHGIENHFVFDEDYNGGDWRLEVHAIDVSEVVNE